MGCIQDALHSEFISGVEIKQRGGGGGGWWGGHAAVTASESCQHSKVHKYAAFIPAALRYFHVPLFFFLDRNAFDRSFCVG